MIETREVNFAYRRGEPVINDIDCKIEDGEFVAFFIGFICALVGVIMIIFNGSVILKLNPIGDLLAFLAGVVWALYSILIRKISTFNYNTVLCTRNIFGYGLLLMLPALLFMDFQ